MGSHAAGVINGGVVDLGVVVVVVVGGVVVKLVVEEAELDAEFVDKVEIVEDDSVDVIDVFKCSQYSPS